MPPSPLARRVLTWLPCEGASSTNCDTGSTCASRQQQWRDMHKPPTPMARHVPTWMSPAIASCETNVEQCRHCFLRDRCNWICFLRDTQVLARALLVSHLQARALLSHLQARTCSCVRVTCIQCCLQRVTCML